MPADPQYLRDHYASLSDAALRAINRSELVETAQKCYDDEVRSRKLASRGGQSTELADSNVEVDEELQVNDEEPDWLKDASEVLSRADLPGTAPAADLEEARDALETAGIPCHLELVEIPKEESSPRQTHLWRLMVPGNLNLRAMSVLDRDIFNQQFEEEWKTHLEMLSDEELREMKPEVAFCGLFDRVERVTRAYDEEIARRGL